MTTEASAARNAIQKQARALGTTELSVPAFVLIVDKLPLLGTGKVDYVTATTLAKERFMAVETAA